MTNWTRIVMNQATKALVSALPFKDMDALEISGQEWCDFGFRKYESTSYPAFDICAPITKTRQHDIIIAEQVFEHILWPYRAASNVYAMLRPGGYFLITTPFMLPIHEVPHDCSRWTPTGIRYFLAECGFPIDSVQSYSWGNAACIRANLKGWVPYRRWRHSLANSPRHPVVVWALAQKSPGN